MQDTGERRVLHATRIPSFDKVIGGGVIPGSTILVLAEPGSGGREFIQTSLVNYCSDSVNRPPAGPGLPAVRPEHRQPVQADHPGEGRPARAGPG